MWGFNRVVTKHAVEVRSCKLGYISNKSIITNNMWFAIAICWSAASNDCGIPYWKSGSQWMIYNGKKGRKKLTEACSEQTSYKLVLN